MSAKPKLITQFIGKRQLTTMLQLHLEAEDGDNSMIDKLKEITQIIELMPKTYQSDSQSDGALVSLHYFTGSSDWWIIERDDMEEQKQAFGFACINGDVCCAELGYINIVELLELGAELDLYWKIRTIGDVKGGLFKEAA